MTLCSLGCLNRYSGNSGTTTVVLLRRPRELLQYGTPKKLRQRIFRRLLGAYYNGVWQLRLRKRSPEGEEPSGSGPNPWYYGNFYTGLVNGYDGLYAFGYGLGPQYNGY